MNRLSLVLARLELTVMVPDRFFVLFLPGTPGIYLLICVPLSFLLLIVSVALSRIAWRARLNKLADL